MGTAESQDGRTGDAQRRIQDLVTEWARDDFRRLAMRNEPNIWDIVYPEGAAEIRYSRVLRWLFDPNERHGLGTWFANAFMQSVPDSNFDANKGFTHSTTARVEWRTADIVVADPTNGVGLVIENKVVDGGTHPHGKTTISQLDWVYYLMWRQYEELNLLLERELASTGWKSARKELDALERMKPELHPWHEDGRREWRRYAVFLTPTGEHVDPRLATTNHWKPVPFADVSELLAEAILRTPSLDAAKIMRDLRSSMDRTADRRSSETVDRLFFSDHAADKKLTDRTPRFAEILTALADHRGLSGPSAGRFYDTLLGAASWGDPSTLWGLLRDAAKREGISEEGLTDLLTFTWEKRPKDRQDHSKSDAITHFIPILRDQVERQGASERWNEFQIGVAVPERQKRMSITIFCDGHEYWFAGSKDDILPSTFQYLRPPESEGGKKRPSTVRRARFACERTLEEWRDTKRADGLSPEEVDELVAEEIATLILETVTADAAGRGDR